MATPDKSSLRNCVSNAVDAGLLVIVDVTRCVFNAAVVGVNAVVMLDKSAPTALLALTAFETVVTPVKDPD
jgi:hypothetical protein